MSDLFASRDTADHLLARAAANSVDSFDDLSAPGFFTGLPSGTGLGVMRGGAKAATGLGIAAGGAAQGLDLAQNVGDILDTLEFDASGRQIQKTLPAHTEAQDAAFRATEDLGQSAIDFWTPRANEVGRAGQVLGGLAEVALPLAATAGNPSLLVGSTTATAGKSLVDQGLDAGTAAPVAALEGVATYAGLKAPIVGKSLLTRMASGALGNVAVGSASRAAEKAALESQGYDEQAKMYAQDGESFSTDFLLGLLFGGVHHVTAGKSVNVEQNVPRDESSQKLGDLPMRGSGEGRAADLSVMSSDLSARLAEDAYPNLGTAEKVELQGLRERLQEAGQADPAALPEVWKREIANASRGLRQALGGDLAVPAVPSGTSQPGDINPRLKPSDVDAILALRNTNYFARETAPGVPADTLAAAGHQSALEAAINQLSRGEPVDVGDAVARHEGAEFVDDGRMARNARSAAEIDNELPHPVGEAGVRNPIDFNATPEVKLQQLKALTAENVPVVERVVADLNKDLAGTDSKLNVKEDLNILSKASRPSILARKPWHGVEHIRDALRFKTVIDRVDQLSGVVEVLKKHGIGVEKVDTGKLLKPGDWGWRIVALDLRMPNGQLVEHYMPLKEMEAAKKSEGHKLFEKWRNKDVMKLSPDEIREFAADRKKSRELYQDAWEAAAARTGLDDTAALASLKSFEDSAASLTASRSSKSSANNGTSVRHSPPIFTAENSGDRTTTESGSSLNVKTSDTGTSSEILPPRGQPGVDHNISDLSLDEALKAKPETSAEAPTPEIAALAQLVDENPDAQVLLGFDESGEPRRVTVAQALDEIRTEYEQAINDTKAYDAAVSCFMGHG